ncbi:putative transcription factor bHLH family [Helianthus annuus]|nr:putative transcription factor bHLH family [Helianthus annuus]KAJ0882052.1 putative transcription factor bHLH family [Helianthus annuus]
MALETIIYPHGQIGNFGYDYMLQEDHIFGGLLEATNNINHQQISDAYWGDYSSSSSVMHVNDPWDPKSSPEECTGGDMKMESPTEAEPTTAVGRRKRRRTKSGKNKEELENQRMTHIKVERNRRKQMNEYLAVIRSLMPSCYVQRGDQASIVGGAINFVKELEQQLQTLEVQKRATINGYSTPPPPQPFGYFFSFPQYSIHRTSDDAGGSATTANNRLPAMADIEVTMVESQANIKILSKKRHSQLLKMVAGLQCLWFTVLHLNVTTVEEMVLYTASVKLEDRCQLSTVDEIADAVNCLLFQIEEESRCSN